MSPMTISNARDTSIAKGGASPVMLAETSLYGALEPLTIELVTKTRNRRTFQVEETGRWIQTMGSVQPLKARELEIKPEGERRWTWLKIYALPALALEPKDTVKWDGVVYRVMGAKNWKAKGLMYYELVADYQVPAGYGD